MTNTKKALQRRIAELRANAIRCFPNRSAKEQKMLLDFANALEIEFLVDDPELNVGSDGRGSAEVARPDDGPTRR
jgi:hypothetical protein